MILKVIQAGIGDWGKDWTQNVLWGMRGLEVTGYVDSNSQIIKSAREDLKLPAERCFVSIEEAFKKVDCDAVVITASLPGHVPLARAALKAYKHVLVEKPFAPTIKEARELVELAARKKKILMVSQNYRFSPLMRWLQKVVKIKKFGRLCSVAIDFRKYSNQYPKKGHKHYYIDHPLLMNMAIHQFDLLRMVTGTNPKRVFCMGINPQWSNFQDPPAAFATAEFPNSVTVSYRGSWMSHGPDTQWAGEWSIEFETAHIRLLRRDDEQGETDSAVIYTNGSRDGKQVKIPKVNFPLARKGALKAFMNAVERKKMPETSGKDNIGTLQFMKAMVKSAETGKVVTV